jgi:ABC-type transport system substrate-binding protein
MAPLAARDPGAPRARVPVQQSYALVLNTARPPFDDVRVRRAVDLAIDRARIVESALSGYGIPAAGPVLPDNPSPCPPPCATTPPRLTRCSTPRVGGAGGMACGVAGA